jgi:hypothetical protein
MKKLFIMSLAFTLLTGHMTCCLEQQESLHIKPFMSQQELLKQIPELEDWVGLVWFYSKREIARRFSDVKHSGYSLAGDIKKRPKNNDNILFIKNAVQDSIAKEEIPLKGVDELALKSITERILINRFNELLLQNPGKTLEWCPCIGEDKRIALILLVINELREKFPNKDQHIVYTSFASGNLLLDYLALSELLLSHKNILVNLIDLGYPDIPALSKKNLRTESPRDLHTLHMKTAQESADMIDSFKTKIAQLISQRPDAHYNFEVNIYQNAYDYISYVQRNPKEKSTILLLVDPSVYFFGVEDFPSLANVVNVWINEEYMVKPLFTLYLPRHGEIHLYQKKVSSASEKEYLKDQLLSLIASAHNSKNPTTAFINALLERSMFSEKITDKLLEKNFPNLSWMKDEGRKKALKEGEIDYDLLNSVTPIKLGDVPVLLSWASDAHISFQDLVWDAIVPNAIIYQLYAFDPEKRDNKNNKIIKINPEIYKKSDVVTPNAAIAIEGKVRVSTK